MWEHPLSIRAKQVLAMPVPPRIEVEELKQESGESGTFFLRS
jgi:hypothetical protein